MADNDSPDPSPSLTESARARAGEKIPHWRLVNDPGRVTERALNHRYRGSGADADPYVVEFLPEDQGNPMVWPRWKRWGLTIDIAIATLAVSSNASSYSGGVNQMMEEFDVSNEVITLGLSFFVLGFVFGPLFWGPMSEMYGRQPLFLGTFGCLAAFNAGGAGAQNVQSLLVIRFFAGFFGSSPLTNGGGVVSDLFPANERGLGMSLFALAPFLGPALGPIVGGFVGLTVGWRWIQGVMAIFTGVLWIFGALTIPETYAPVILEKRAAALSKKTGRVYLSLLEVRRGKITLGKALKTALSRPWVLLFFEPIVLILSIYQAIIYGTLFLFFGAFPIVYQEARGWNEGVGGLAFTGILVGMVLGNIYTIVDNKRYVKTAQISAGGSAPPEARLPPALVACVAIPIGLFWFAWTCYPTSIHWSVSIMAGAPFGFGTVIVFLSSMNYLIDSYVVYAASVLAANALLRSLFGAIFPLFTPYMYQDLGPRWASSIPAFLALACVPFPFLFYKYGATIRKRCKFAAEAARILEQIRAAQDESSSDSEEEDENAEEQKEESAAEV